VLKVTADTNILVSGLVFRHGKPAQLLRMALAGEINLTVSQAILGEMAEVLARKFGTSQEEVAEATVIVKEAARTVTPRVELNVIKEDPPDNRVLECAVSAGADYIVSGDKDLLRLKQYDAIQIKSVGEFLEIARHARGV